MKLHCKKFDTKEELCNWVNKNKIKVVSISETQARIPIPSNYTLFFYISEELDG